MFLLMSFFILCWFRAGSVGSKVTIQQSTTTRACLHRNGKSFSQILQFLFSRFSYFKGYCLSLKAVKLNLILPSTEIFVLQLFIMFNGQVCISRRHTLAFNVCIILYSSVLVLAFYLQTCCNSFGSPKPRDTVLSQGGDI